MRVELRSDRLILVIVTDEQARRPWDGRRLLRFLTSLAMLALAATLHLPATATAATAATAGVSPITSASAVVAPETPASQAERSQPARSRTRTVPAGPAPVRAGAPDTVFPAGADPQGAGPRAPPAA